MSWKVVTGEQGGGLIISGINDFADKADFGDRSIFLHLPRISRSVRQTEEAFWADLDRDCPRILGGLLDAVSAGMRALADVRFAGLSRLADAEHWGEAVTRGLGGAAGTFTNALGTNRSEANEWTLEESPVAVALIDLAIRCSLFRGTMQELLQTLAALSATASDRLSDWPNSPRALLVKVRQLAPQLRSIGIDLELRRAANGPFMTATMAEDEIRSEGNRGRSLIGKRLRAYSEQENRAIG